MTHAEKFFDEKIKEIAKGKTVLDIGSGHRFQGLLRYKEYFSNCDYKTIDIREDYNPDIVADIHNLPVKDESANAVICKSVLQFTQNPFKVADEIFRVLKTGGTCFVYVPFLYPYHGSHKISERDYWRFSIDGIHELFGKFKKIETCPIKGHFETAANILPQRQNIIIKFITSSAKFLDRRTLKLQSGKQVSGHLVYLIK